MKKKDLIPKAKNNNNAPPKAVIPMNRFMRFGPIIMGEGQPFRC